MSTERYVYLTLAVLVSVLLVGAAGPVRAEQRASGTSTAELLKRIEALEKEVSELRQGAHPCETGEGEGTAPPAPEVRASDTTAPPKGAITARHIDASAGEQPAASPAPAAVKVVAGYDKGFFVASPDGAYKLRLNGFIQTDGRFFIDNSIKKEVDQFVIRRARFDLRAKLWKRYTIRLTPDFAGSNLSLKYAYIETEFSDALMLRAGKQKTPFGIENLDGATNLPFAERALPENLVPGRDIGVQLFGDPTGGRLSYAIAVVNGVPDGSDGDVDVNDAVDVVARLFATPFAPSTYSPFRGAGFGIAGTWGREQGSSSSSQLPSFKTTGRLTFFDYEDDAIADGDHWRVSPQASWYEGPFGLLTEYVRSSQRVELDDERAWVHNEAWQVRGSWIVTGERASSDRVDPASPFNFGGGDWGAWQLALRWSSLDVDRHAFTRGFADPTESARHADAIGTAINWYLNRNVSMYFDYEHTMFQGGADSGDRKNEDVFLTRMQLEF